MTSLTKTSIANFALAHLGDHRIDDFDEADPGAAKVRDQWDLTRLACLGSYEWGFASKTKALDRAGNTPAAQWLYAYDKPADWIRTNAVSDSSSFDRDNAFRRWMDREGQIQTDAAAIYMDYVRDHETVGSWHIWFVDYVSVSLAMRINPSITTSQSTSKLMKDLLKETLAVAKARDAQMQPLYKPPRGNWIKARRGSWSGVGR